MTRFLPWFSVVLCLSACQLAKLDGSQRSQVQGFFQVTSSVTELKNRTTMENCEARSGRISGDDCPIYFEMATQSLNTERGYVKIVFEARTEAARVQYGVRKLQLEGSYDYGAALGSMRLSGWADTVQFGAVTYSMETSGSNTELTRVHNIIFSDFSACLSHTLVHRQAEQFALNTDSITETEYRGLLGKWISEFGAD